MSIYQTPNSPYWRIDLVAPSGQRVRRSTGTTERKKALEYHDKLRATLWEQARLGVSPEYTFEQAALQMLERSEGQQDYDVKLRHVGYWTSVFAGRFISSLKSEEIFRHLPTHWIGARVKSPRRLSNATKNRYLSTIRRIFSVAQEIGWITTSPRLTTFREPKVNIRWLTKEDANALLSKMQLEWMHQVCRFALATGARSNEILSLTWDKVDIDRSMAWVTNDLAKNGRSRPMPLNSEAVALLRERKLARTMYCFTRQSGRRITQVDKRTLDRAAEMADIKPLKFHDLRHTWASWHVQSGTPLMVLKELGGWETIQMVQKYAHLDAGHLANYVGVTEFTSHLRHTIRKDNKKAA